MITAGKHLPFTQLTRVSSLEPHLVPRASSKGIPLLRARCKTECGGKDRGKGLNVYILGIQCYYTTSTITMTTLCNLYLNSTIRVYKFIFIRYCLSLVFFIAQTNDIMQYNFILIYLAGSFQSHPF